MNSILVWEKLGRLFPPEGRETLYGQVPFALSLDDRIRVFYSTRGGADNRGLYVSFGGYIDLSLDNLTDTLGGPRMVGLDLGGPGEFDEFGVMLGSLVQNETSMLGYYCGWSRPASRPYAWNIGLAESCDGGQSFRKLGPVKFRARHDMPDVLRACPIVFRTSSGYRMFFLKGRGWLTDPSSKRLESTYVLRSAVSEDGMIWLEEEKDMVPQNSNNESQTSSTMIQDDRGYHLLFSYRDALGFRSVPGAGYRIGYAFSHNGREWTRNDGFAGLTCSEEGWDSQMVCYPSAFEKDGQIYLLYAGNYFGRDGFGLARLVAGLEGPTKVVTSPHGRF